MKYTRLTKEQFEEMQQEFINFLATQSITAEEWKKIKEEKPATAEEELDLFSDLVWEGVLKKAEFLEHISKQQLFLFQINESEMTLIGIKVSDPSINITTREGYKWLQNNLMSEQVELYTSSKELTDDRNKDVFALIQQGASITKGELFRYFEGLVELS